MWGHSVVKDESYKRGQRHCLCASGPNDFPHPDGGRKHPDRAGELKHRKIPEEIYALFPVLFGHAQPQGWQFVWGQQQQLAIARALVTNPKVLLLDEPTEGIQPSIIKDIAKALNEIRKLREITIVVSEQVLSFAMDVADRLFVIEGGRLVHETTRADTDANRIKAYLSV